MSAEPTKLDAAPAPGVFGIGSVAMIGTLWVVWGISYPIMAEAVRWFEPLTMRCIVMTIAGLVMVGYALATGQHLRLPRPYWGGFVIASLCNMTILQIGMTYGVYLVGGARSAVLIYTMTIWAALFAWWLLGEAITWRRAVALAMGIAAVCALLAQNLTDVRNAPLGVALNLFAALGFGFGMVWTKRSTWPLGLPATAGWQLLIGVVPLLAIWLVVRPDVPLAVVPPLGWAALAYMTLCANVIAYFAWFPLIKRLPATVLGLGSMATPCIGVLSSAVIAGETVKPNDLLALALVCGALALVLSERPKPIR
ncbi:MAG: EamA family transporter [Alphaproteobacteria bacterium]|nr:EamA family transporter [Alphaproteobacteria bacterium]